MKNKCDGHTCTNINVCHSILILSVTLKLGSFLHPFIPSPPFFSPFSYCRAKVVRRSKLISREDWWLTIDVSILSRQRHFLQLCREYKHDHVNNGGITSAIKERGRRRLGGDKWQERNRRGKKGGNKPGQCGRWDGISCEKHWKKRIHVFFVRNLLFRCNSVWIKETKALCWVLYAANKIQTVMLGHPCIFDWSKN